MIRRASTAAIIAPPSPASSPRSYTQFHRAIHNSGQLYTIRAELYTIPRSYTQFARTYTQFGQFGLTYTQFGSIRPGSARFRPARGGPPLRSSRRRRPRRTRPFRHPFGSIRPHVVPMSSPTAPSRCRRAPGRNHPPRSRAAGRPAIHNSRAARRGGSLSYTQFPGAIHNSRSYTQFPELYTIPGSYTRFAARSRRGAGNRRRAARFAADPRRGTPVEWRRSSRRRETPTSTHPAPAEGVGRAP